MSATTELHPIFDDCRAKVTVGRMPLTEHFVIDGYIYATDGKIIVRQKTPMCRSHMNVPPVQDLMWNVAGEWFDLPEVCDETLQDCPECDGDGCARYECGDCSGSGDTNCTMCGHPQQCDTCQGCGVVKGKKKCGTCAGAGKTMQPNDDDVVIGPAAIGAGYLLLLRRHGVTRISISEPNRPMRFQLGDIEGMVMPRCVRRKA